jgi:hypothetical protein
LKVRRKSYGFPNYLSSQNIQQPGNLYLYISSQKRICSPKKLNTLSENQGGYNGREHSSLDSEEHSDT